MYNYIICIHILHCNSSGGFGPHAFRTAKKTKGTKDTNFRGKTGHAHTMYTYVSFKLDL